MANIPGAFVEGRKEIVIESQGKQLKFFADEIGYLASQNIALQTNAGKNTVALLVAESVTDEAGNKFTYDEVLRLRKEFAAPFFDAVIEVNGYKDTEKKS